MPDVNILSTKTIVPPLVEQAAAAGIRIYNKDFIRTQPVISKKTADSLSGLSHPTFVFTSTNAVDALYRLLQQYPNRIDPADVYCMAGRTSEKLTELFPELTVKGTGNYAGELAEHIIADGVKELIFFSGNLRRDELPDRLKQHGVQVTEMEVYKTWPQPSRTEGVYDGVIFFSPSAANSFFSLNTINDKTICFAIGETTAEAIRKYTNNRIMVAEFPRQEDLISLIIDHYKN